MTKSLRFASLYFRLSDHNLCRPIISILSELTDGLLSGEIKQAQLKEKFEKDLEQKAFKIKELEERLAENGAIVDDLRRANDELNRQIDLQNAQPHQPGPGGDSKTGTESTFYSPLEIYYTGRCGYKEDS